MSWLHAVIDVPADQHDRAADFWAAALGYDPGEPWPGHPGLRSLEPPEGDAYVHVQTVPGVPRVHLDLDVPDVPAASRRLQDLGATWVRRSEDWTTLTSPGGLPVCLVRARPRQRPHQVRRHAAGDRRSFPAGVRPLVCAVALKLPAWRRGV